MDDILQITLEKVEKGREIGPAKVAGLGVLPGHVRNRAEVARYLLGNGLCAGVTGLAFRDVAGVGFERAVPAVSVAKRKVHSVKSNAAREAYKLGLEKDQFRVVRVVGENGVNGWSYELGNRAYFSKKKAVVGASIGELPPVPDFSAETHRRFRGKLMEVVGLAQAGDLEGLRAVEIKAVSTSPKAIARYRDLAVMALEAREEI